MNKKWYKYNYSKLTKAGKKSKALVNRICKILSKHSGRNFYVTMDAWKNIYEGHIIDSGYCIEKKSDSYFSYELASADDKNTEPIGMIFWGGFFSRLKYKDAESRAWVSLLEDCIGQCCDVECREIHNLTKSLKYFGPQLDFNCTLNTINEKFSNYEY